MRMRLRRLGRPNLLTRRRIRGSRRIRRRLSTRTRRQLKNIIRRSKLSKPDPTRRRSAQKRARTPNLTKRTMSTIEHDASAHRFNTEVDGNQAYLEYSLAGAVMTITHTRVPKPIEGRGIAAGLMKAALAAARAHGWAVEPACSYARAYMAKNGLVGNAEHVDQLLDEALDESFPASDSPSVGGST